MLQGKFGWSFRTGQPVAALIASRLPITIELALLAVLSVCFVAIPLGVAASVSRSVRVRTLVQIIGVLGLSLPNFWIAILLIIGRHHSSMAPGHLRPPDGPG
jgi:peptide/nickel transport system permease protein